MHYSSIKNHLKPYVIVRARKTTINHAFAAAIAPNDEYSESVVREAVIFLGQDPDSALTCVYCDAPAQTWDHVFATVKDSEFSGYGHRLGNLLPCCKPCNSSKGNKNWKSYLASQNIPNLAGRISTISAYLEKYSLPENPPRQSVEYNRLQEIKREVMALLSEADRIAKVIRESAT